VWSAWALTQKCDRHRTISVQARLYTQSSDRNAFDLLLHKMIACTHGAYPSQCCVYTGQAVFGSVRLVGAEQSAARKE
jgi:hypothetical protein